MHDRSQQDVSANLFCLMGLKRCADGKLEGASDYKRMREKREKAVRLLCSEGHKIRRYRTRGRQLEQERLLWEEGKLHDVPVVQLAHEAYYTGRVTEADSQSGCGSWPQSAAKGP
ncbi:hypothetical protein ACFX11_030299 [Malus domestica]